MPFEWFIGVDYSGAKTATDRLPSLQVAIAAYSMPVKLFHCPQVVDKIRPCHWNRAELAAWIIEQARNGPRFLAGIDHAFGVPVRFMNEIGCKDWPSFLNVLSREWPADQPGETIDRLRKRSPFITGLATELRLTEKWTSSAKSVFQFDVQGQVAKSTFAGLPWIHRIREAAGDRIHFWPFDGWDYPADKHVMAEVYPALFRKRYDRVGITTDQQDACAIARWLAESADRQILDLYCHPPLTDDERQTAELEGWILGVT